MMTLRRSEIDSGCNPPLFIRSLFVDPLASRSLVNVETVLFFVGVTKQTNMTLVFKGKTLKPFVFAILTGVANKP